jgi:hypothetical protein
VKAQSQPHNLETLMAYEPSIDPEVTTQVGQEILENRLDPGTWATALSSSQGKRQEALATYARLRIQQVSAHRRTQHRKAKSFESRRLLKCFGVRTVQDLLDRSNPSKQLNYLKPRLSVVSLIILCIGSAGGIGALGRLLNDSLPAALSAVLPIVALFAGLIMVAMALVLRFTLPKRWIMLGWNTGLTCVCTVVCFSSLLCGVKLIARAAPLTPDAEPQAPVALFVAPATPVTQNPAQALAASNP